MTALPAGLSYVVEAGYPAIRHDASGRTLLGLPFDDARWCDVVGPLLAGPDWTVGVDDLEAATHQTFRAAYRAVRDLRQKWDALRDDRIVEVCHPDNLCTRCGTHCPPGSPDECPQAGKFALPLDVLERVLGLDPLPFPWPEPAEVVPS